MKSFKEIYADKSAVNNKIQSNVVEKKQMTDGEIYKTERIINNIFEELKTICTGYGATWRTSTDVANHKIAWTKGFIKNNLSNPELIQNGLDKCHEIGLQYIPPFAKFLGYCTPNTKELGLPSHDDAYNEAIKRASPSSRGEQWSHAVVYHAYKKTGQRALFEPTDSYRILEIKKLFFANYDLTLKMFVNNEELDELPVLLTHQHQGKVEATVSGSSALSDMLKKLK